MKLHHVWRVARQALARLILGRKYVGTDRVGNDYFLEEGKRMVDYKERLPNPRSIPHQWNRWLRRQRPDAPSNEEMAAEAKVIREKQNRVDKLRHIEQAEREAEGDVVFIKGRPFTSLEHLIKSINDEPHFPDKHSQ